MFVCLYVCMYDCTYICMHVRIVCVYVSCMYERTSMLRSVCMHRSASIDARRMTLYPALRRIARKTSSRLPRILASACIQEPKANPGLRETAPGTVKQPPGTVKQPLEP